jgi:hypothetical protein
MSETIEKDEPIVEEITPPSVAGPISFPRLGVIVISVLLGLIVILSIIIWIL